MDAEPKRPRGSGEYSREELHKLRNEIPVQIIIAEVLELPWKLSEGYFRFLCPLCREFHTAINPRTNLGRCFRCRRNFNPIDLVMLEKGQTFREVVAYLREVHRRLQP